MADRFLESAKRIEREDAILFMNAAMASTGQSEFYEDAGVQDLSLGFLHAYMLGNYRPLYARCLAAGINHYNQGLIIRNLLANGRPVSLEETRHEVSLMLAALRVMPPQRAFKVLARLADERINNRRARALIRDYIAMRPDQAFDAVKYRRLVKRVAGHAHLRLGDERNDFLFQRGRQDVFETELFESWRQAHYSQAALSRLPYSIAEGFAAKHGLSRETLMTIAADSMTVGEKFRLQRAAAENRAEEAVSVDFRRLPLDRIAIYMLALSPEQRRARRTELEAAMRSAADRIIRRHPFRLGRTAAILDRSYSMSGSAEKRRRPLALSVCIDLVLRQASEDYLSLWSPALEDTFEAHATGQSDLAGPLLKALKWGADQIVVLSDGFENDPPNGFAEVMRVYRERLDTQREVSIIHLNPVLEAVNFQPRSISALVPTVGIRDVEDVFALISFARFSEGKASIDVLQRYLDARSRELQEQAERRRQSVADRDSNQSSSGSS